MCSIVHLNCSIWADKTIVCKSCQRIVWNCPEAVQPVRVDSSVVRLLLLCYFSSQNML